MENLVKKQNRAEVLTDRRERVIGINNLLRNKYFGNDLKIMKKMLQAQRIFKAIRDEKDAIAIRQYASNTASFERNFLMSTKGLNGSQILMATKDHSLTMNDLKTLTQP